jgi:serine/threonine protein kinase
MDLVAGSTLRERLDEERRLSAAEAAQLARSLAVSLASLAEARVTHGDVKPSNVVLGPEGPVLVDFGLARRAGQAAPRERGGTLTYLAPEVVRGEQPTPRSDVYSLGVVLFEALTGRLPYAASGADLAAHKVEGGAADLAPLLELGMAPGLVAIVESALESDVGRRTAQAGELALALLPYAT